MQQCLGNYYHRAYHAEGTWNLMYMYVIFTQQAFIQGILSEPRAFVRPRQKSKELRWVLSPYYYTMLDFQLGILNALYIIDCIDWKHCVSTIRSQL